MSEFSLVIINDNAAEYLAGLISSIAAQYNESTPEIIFVDNASEDESTKLANDIPGVRIHSLKKKTVNIGKLYNIGLSLSDKEYVLFVHSDIIFPRGFFNEIASCIDETKPDFINFEMDYPDTNPFGLNQIGIMAMKPEAGLSYRRVYDCLPNGTEQLLECSEGCFMIRKTAIHDARFPEIYIKSFHDFEILNKIAISNGNIVRIQTARPIHYFIEAHEQVMAISHDMDTFIRRNPEIIELRKKDVQAFKLNENIEKLSKWGQALDAEIKGKNLTLLSLNSEVDKLSQWGKALNVEIEQKNKVIVTLNSEVEKLANWGQALNSEIERKNKVIVTLNSEVEKLAQWGQSIDEEIKQKNLLIDELSVLPELTKALEQKLDNVYEQLFDAQKQIARLHNDIEEQKQITKQDSLKIEALTRLKSAFEEQINGLSQTIKNQQGHIEQLLEKERRLNNILSSNGWKLMLKYYKIRDFILPAKSKRRLVSKLLFKLITRPSNIKHLSPHNIRKFKYYLKTENADMLENRVDAYLQRFNESQAFSIKHPVKSIIFDKLIFKKEQNPLVSIIIPVFNQWEYTYSCLKSILSIPDKTPYDVIIADDVSEDQTKEIKNHVENVLVIRNKTNLGFLRNCNNAAKYAKGKYIIFLNNDTNVQQNWLDSLVELAEKNKTTGIVGSKLVYPDGKLQEAGGIIWKDASGWNYGRLYDPALPQYNYIKEVDYVSGASMMIRKSLWNEIGGFDERFAPAYFEDADMAFEVRKRGYKAMFQPKSVVVHFEGISHGTNEDSGLKKCQAVNREKFITKWKDVLQKGHFVNGQNVFQARDRSRDKKTILVIDHYVPHYDKDAGSRTTFQYLKLFSEMGMNVKFLGSNFYKHEPYSTELEQSGIEILHGVWFRDNWEKWLAENGKAIDYVYLMRPYIAIDFIDKIKKYTASKILYNSIDFHYIREARQYKLTKNKEHLKQARNFKKQEFYLFNKSDAILTISNYEKFILEKKMPGKKIFIIPTYLYDNLPLGIGNEFENRTQLIFVGNFVHTPNVDGILWFCKEIFPEISALLPDVILNIVGGNTPAEILNLKSPKVNVTGFVTEKELESYYSKAKIIIAPLRFGAGVKGKIIEAIAYGIPVVTTKIGVEGIPDCDGTICVADTESDFIKCIINIFKSKEKWETIRNNQIRYAKQNLSTSYAQNIINEILK